MVEGDAAEALMQLAREVDAGLIVVGVLGCDFVARTLRGSIGERSSPGHHATRSSFADVRLHDAAGGSESHYDAFAPFHAGNLLVL